MSSPAALAVLIFAAKRPSIILVHSARPSSRRRSPGRTPGTPVLEGFLEKLGFSGPMAQFEVTLLGLWREQRPKVAP